MLGRRLEKILKRIERACFRVADNLYWMSRYLERAEHTARLIDVNLALDLERSPEARGQYWVRVLQSLQTAPPADGIDAYRVTRHLTFDQSNPASVVACILAARRTRARCASRSVPRCGSRSTAFT